MTDPIDLAHRLAGQLKIVWHGPTVEKPTAIDSIVGFCADDTMAFYLIARGLIRLASGDLREARPMCSSPDHPVESQYYGFDAAGVPEGPTLQAIRAWIAYSNDDLDIAETIINGYCEGATHGAGEFIAALVAITCTCHVAVCAARHG